MIHTSLEHNQDVAATLLLRDDLMVARTDTLYGVIARTTKCAVEKVYEVRGRDDTKPCIVLLAEASQAFGRDSEKLQTTLQSVDMSYPTTIVIDQTDAPSYITRGHVSTAYRIVTIPTWQMLLRTVGPVVAPSANPQGCVPAHDCQQAYAYFGENIEGYFDDGQTPADTTPSRIVRIKQDGSIERLR